MINTVAFIGLGAMGYRMAAHLPQAFDQVYVANRTHSTAQQHAEQYGTLAVDFAQAVQAQVIFSCLPTSTEVEQLIEQYPPRSGAIWVDCTSGEPQAAQRLAQHLATRGVDFLDAPVSGQTIGAEQGTLTVMVGGCAEVLKRARPAIEPFAHVIEHVGGSGSGFAVKAVNNLLLAANLMAAAEGLSILKAHRISLDAALRCINASSGQSVATSQIIPNRVLNRQFPLTFALPLLVKDVGIAQQLAREAQLPLPLTDDVENLLQLAVRQHSELTDFSTAVQLYERWYQHVLS